MRRFAALLLSLLAFAAHPLAAQTIAYEALDQEPALAQGGSERFVEAAPGPADPAGREIASYGPFRVLDERRAALVDVTDTGSPGQFAAMLRDFPGLTELDLVDCPGTFDDRANLQLGRMIRARGIATRVPSNGSVRSGAVELFLAGVERQIDDGAEFAVHAWLDESGRQAGDYAADAPANRRYLDYYREMGMSPSRASAFYAMTNSVPFEQARWLDAAEMRDWVEEPRALAFPRLAVLDLIPAFQ